MGYNVGFDMVPRLENYCEDQGRWQNFLLSVSDTYKHDPAWVLKDNYVEFNVGDHPSLPFHGYKFLRFSSKVSSCSTTVAEAYIEGVFRIARSAFGNRIKFWHEGIESYGHYDWEEVNESVASYDDEHQQVQLDLNLLLLIRC
jgi:hypothetical protein